MRVVFTPTSSMVVRTRPANLSRMISYRSAVASHGGYRAVFTGKVHEISVLRVQEITFVPPARLFPFSKSPIVDELIQRVDATRGR
jgi:hypothetical protein